jgi:hypothetical protein
MNARKSTPAERDKLMSPLLNEGADKMLDVLQDMRHGIPKIANRSSRRLNRAIHPGRALIHVYVLLRPSAGSGLLAGTGPTRNRSEDDFASTGRSAAAITERSRTPLKLPGRR